jgi:hypothetical protein
MNAAYVGRFVSAAGLLLSGFCHVVSAQTIGKQLPTLIDYINSRLAATPRSGPRRQAKLGIESLCPIYSPNTALQHAAGRVLNEYGAIFVGDNNSFVDFALDTNADVARLTVQCIYPDEEAVRRYQSLVKPRREIIDGTAVELQADAMTALLEARTEALTKNLRITPRGGSTGARRSYAETKRLWDSRFYPGLAYWTARKVITTAEAADVKRMAMLDQISTVLEWEDKRHAYFSKDMKKSIMYSVAPPGSSQHLFMLAIDIEQFANRAVREILARHGWYQTVKSDLPHFTYLGIKDSLELPSRGLKREEVDGQEFWIPRID